jgi:hypothetical protein
MWARAGSLHKSQNNFLQHVLPGAVAHPRAKAWAAKSGVLIWFSTLVDSLDAVLTIAF